MEVQIDIKNNLLRRLKQEHCFWSFDMSATKEIPDNILIEKTLIYLDMEEIDQNQTSLERLHDSTRRLPLHFKPIFSMVLFQNQTP